jgi:hypothetical protein
MSADPQEDIPTFEIDCSPVHSMSQVETTLEPHPICSSDEQGAKAAAETAEACRECISSDATKHFSQPNMHATRSIQLCSLPIQPYRATGTNLPTNSASRLLLPIRNASSAVTFLGSGTYRPNLSSTIFKCFGFTLV